MGFSNFKSESQVIPDMLLLVVEVISEFNTIKCLFCHKKGLCSTG